MSTEKSLRDNAHLVKALMGIAAEDFYPMLGQIEQRLPLYEQHRLQRETRPRALAGAQFWIVTDPSDSLARSMKPRKPRSASPALVLVLVMGANALGTDQNPGVLLYKCK